MQREPSPAELMSAIVDLSNATANGFSQLGRELRSEMKEGFDRVDGRLDRVETRLTSIEGEVGGIRHWMNRTDGRLDSLERRKKH